MSGFQKPNTTWSSDIIDEVENTGASSPAAAAFQTGHAAAAAPAGAPQAGQAPSGPVFAPQAGQAPAGLVANPMQGPLFPALAQKRRVSKMQVLQSHVDVDILAATLGANAVASSIDAWALQQLYF